MKNKNVTKIPANHPVRPLKKGQKASDRVTCGYCNLSWDDAISTSMTPARTARCPFESFHVYKEAKRKKSPYTLKELVSIMIKNAEVAPDPRMKGMTDCYLVTIDDMIALTEYIDKE